jgi:hypothetical protein
MTKAKKKKPKKKIRQQFKAELVDKFSDEDLFDDCPVCQAMKAAQEQGRELKAKELKEALKKAKEKGAFVGGEWFAGTGSEKELSQIDLEYIGTADDFKIPKWMKCSWQRVSCGKNDCPICGRIKRDRQRHLERSGDPDQMKSVLEDVGRNFKEVAAMIKRDCEARGIKLANIEEIQEPPEPEKFPLYLKMEEWNREVFKIGNEAELSGNWWIYTEAAADLFWYANTLLAKAYRQLCNKWHLENGYEYGDFDHQYTGRVLKECLKILKKSLRELIKGNMSQRKEFDLTLSQLLKLEKEIIRI